MKNLINRIKRFFKEDEELVEETKQEETCSHEHWGQCGFTNMGRCYDCGINFYFTIKDDVVYFRVID